MHINKGRLHTFRKEHPLPGVSAWPHRSCYCVVVLLCCGVAVFLFAVLLCRRFVADRPGGACMFPAELLLLSDSAANPVLRTLFVENKKQKRKRETGLIPKHVH